MDNYRDEWEGKRESLYTWMVKTGWRPKDEISRGRKRTR